MIQPDFAVWPSLASWSLRRILLAELILGLSLLAILCIRLDKPFHGAYERVSYAHVLMARNHLRYGLDVTRGMGSLAAGGLQLQDLGGHWWIHHPPLMPLYVAGWFRVFGESFAVARLSAIALTVLALPLVGFIARKLGGPAAGLWACLLYAASGTAVWDGRRPEYFQLALLLMLLALAFYVSWREKPTSGKWGGFLVSMSLACLVDWPPFLFAGGLAAHLCATDGRRGLWRAVGLLGIGAASFGVFLIHVIWIAGSQSVAYLFNLLGQETRDASRLRAFWNLCRSCGTHTGVVASLAFLASFLPVTGLNVMSRGTVITLSVYGLLSSQFFLVWTFLHGYVAVWFLMPAMVLGGGLALSALLERISSIGWRRGIAILVGVAILGQGAAYGILRHRQDNWYAPQREIIATVRAEIAPQSWVASPLKGFEPFSAVYETDCHLFWGVQEISELEPLVRRTRVLYVLVPKPESTRSFWSDLGSEGRRAYGVIRLNEHARLLRGATCRDLGSYDLYTLESSRSP